MTTQKTDTGLFSDLKIDENILQILTKNGFTTPTPIQHQVIAAGLEGKDIVGIAQTGTGKTLAFGIPIIQQILASQGKQALIVVPTRELAIQVDEALTQIGRPLGLRTTVIIGGISQNLQVRSLKGSPHVVIATPGRLSDLIKQGKYKIDKISIIALDEADRMLDDGFLPQIKQILQTIPKDHQTLLFSATMPKTIADLASHFMKLPLRVEIAPQGTSSENIEQEIFVIEKDKKFILLESVLNEHKGETILIFSRTKHGAKRIALNVRAMGHRATEIHSNRSQPQRKAALEGFTSGKFRVMVATDIAARGIDVEKLSLVINFDLPDNTEDYVHRVGRTGRAGRSGKAISFVTPGEKGGLQKIEKLIRKTLTIASHPVALSEKQLVFSKKTPGDNRGRSGRKKSGNSYGNNNGNGPKSNFSGNSFGKKGGGKGGRSSFNRMQNK